MLKRHSRVAVTIVMLMAGSGVGFADDTHKAPDPALDDELLEFLGSVDTSSDDDTWIEYLSETDIGKVAAKPDNPTVVAAKPPAPSAPPKSSTPGAKQNE